MLSKKYQIQSKCIKLRNKYYTLYFNNLSINRNKCKKAYQRIAFIEKIYRNAE